jgi:hypothetical protein
MPLITAIAAEQKGESGEKSGQMQPAAVSLTLS